MLNTNQRNRRLFGLLKVACTIMLAASTSDVGAQPAQPGKVVFRRLAADEEPGVVRLKNGIVLRGLCSLTNTTDPLLQDQNLELRRVDQKFRDYLVSTRRSQKVIPDPLAVPQDEFLIPQRRTAQQALNYSIGRPQQTPFTRAGRSTVKLKTAANQFLKIEVGIKSVNSQAVEIMGLTHKWQYGVSLNTFSDPFLYPGNGRHGLLNRVKDFSDPDTRLNLVKMLLDAEKYGAAKVLLDDTRHEFPHLAQRCQRTIEQWNNRVGARVLAELNSLRDTGRHEAARRYARNWPDQNLAPLIRVQADRFLKTLEADDKRLVTLQQSVAETLASIDHQDDRRAASRIWTIMKKELDLNTMSRLAAFELLGQDDSLPAESQFALAVTGWLLGTDNAIDSFPAAIGLFEMRFLVQDYLQTKDDESDQRNDLLTRIREQEGFSVDRLAALIRQLPPAATFAVPEYSTEAIDFEIPARTEGVHFLTRLPPEYRPSRAYPVLIAFPQAGVSAEETRAWWRQQTDQHGYILVVPEIYTESADAYNGSAHAHDAILKLMVDLKSGLSVNDNRIFVAGHEIGGEAAMDMASSHPDLFAGVVSIAGLGRRSLQWTAHNHADLPWYIVVGTRQPNYYRRMELLLRKLFKRVETNNRFCDVVLVRYRERGFESYAEELPDLFRWMNLQQRGAEPEKVTAKVTRSTDRSWFWLQLDSVQERFSVLDQAHGHDERPDGAGTVAATIRPRMIRVSQLPGKGWLRLSPDIPALDLTERIRIQVGGRTRTIDYVPSSRDMLKDFRQRRDRSRLCYMNVPL